jgi:hypothetical protein
VSIRDQIIAADDIEVELVEIPEWNVTIMVKSMTGAERGQMLKAVTNKDGQVDISKAISDVLIFTAHDPETEERIFTLADRDLLNEKSGSAIQRAAEVGMRLSGLMPTSIDEAGKDSSPMASIDSPLS